MPAGGFSQAFYREKLYETKLAYQSLESFMKNFWEAWALSKAMLYTWQAGDCSAQSPYNGDFKAAMQAINAKTLVLPFGVIGLVDRGVMRRMSSGLMISYVESVCEKRMSLDFEIESNKVFLFLLLLRPEDYLRIV